MFVSSFLLMGAIAVGAHGLRARDTASMFQLYAYGDEMGGLPVFYADGLASAGDPGLSNSTQAAVVTFTATDRVWTGSPNTTDLNSSKSPTWTNVTFYIPSSDSTSSRIGFANSSSATGARTSGFFFYGNTAMFADDDGVASSWTGLKDASGIFALYWNDTSAGQVPITLRRLPPSSTPPHPPTTSA